MFVFDKIEGVLDQYKYSNNLDKQIHQIVVSLAYVKLFLIEERKIITIEIITSSHHERTIPKYNSS